jgi:hypothetical protein
MSVGWFRPEAGKRLVCIHSRLCPAVMLKTDGASLTAFADGQNVLPSSHGHNDSGKTALRVRAVAVAGPMAVSVTDFDAEPGPVSPPPGAENWLLVWFAHQDEAKNGLQAIFYPLHTGATPVPPSDPEFAEWADLPQLLIFEQPWKKIETASGGLKISFGGPAGKIAVVPLYGAQFLPASETLAWSVGLPPAVLQQCRAMAKRFQRVPVKVTETAQVSGDTVTYKNEFECLTLSDSAAVWVPLPPALALAARHGYPTKIKGSTVDCRQATYHGPYEVVEGAAALEYELPGLRYLTMPQPDAKLDGKDPRLLSELRKAVEETVAAGPLAPILCGNRYLQHARGGELLAVFGRAMPYLDAPLQDRALAYCRRELALNHPLQTPHVFWAGKQERADRRTGEKVQVDGGAFPGYIMIRLEQTVTISTLYEIWQFVRHLKERAEAAAEFLPAARKLYTESVKPADWPTLSQSANFAVRNYCWNAGGLHDRNGVLAGHIGCLRLEELAGNGPQVLPSIQASFAKELAAYYAAYKMPRYFYEAGFLRLEPGRDFIKAYTANNIFGVGLAPVQWNQPEDDVRFVVEWGPYGAIVDDHVLREDNFPYLYAKLSEEHAGFIRDFLKPDYDRFWARLKLRGPTWYLRRGEKLLAAETNWQDPRTSWTFFNAKAWVERPPQAELVPCLDTPCWTGDLYYLDNLLTLLEAPNK